MENRKINVEKEMYKVVLNDKDEFIMIDPDDSGLFDRFAEFVYWLDMKTAEMQKTEADFAKKHKRGVVYEAADGETEIDAEALVELCHSRTAAYREVASKLDGIFGQDALRKFFSLSYELNPDFVPDDLAMYDFLEQLTPIMNDLFGDRRKRIELKYNKNRRGGKGNKYRSKEQLIEDYKG